MGKDNRPPKHLRTLKRGDVREDGMIFWAYSRCCNNGENWLEAGHYEERRRRAEESQKVNRIQRNKSAKKWQDKNREKVRAYARYHYYKTKDDPHVRERKKLWQRSKRSNDMNFRIACNLRNRVRHALHGKAKTDATLSMLGCTIEELREHLESQFQDGMSWDNYGCRGWHIDHIKPCASFDLILDEEQKQCFHFTNLQPLWAKDNLTKSNKYNQ